MISRPHMRTLIAVVLPRRFPYMFIECCVLAAHGHWVAWRTALSRCHQQCCGVLPPAIEQHIERQVQF